MKYWIEIIGWVLLVWLVVWGATACAGVQLPKRAQVSVGKQTKCPDVKVYVVTSTAGMD